MDVNERSSALVGGWASGMIFGVGAGFGSFWLMALGLAVVLLFGVWVVGLETAEWLRERQETSSRDLFSAASAKYRRAVWLLGLPLAFLWKERARLLIEEGEELKGRAEAWRMREQIEKYEAAHGAFLLERGRRGT